MNPAPTPYVPAEYSTLSAGTFNGEPLVEVLHSYPHFGSDDYEVISTTNFLAVVNSQLIFLKNCAGHLDIILAEHVSMLRFSKLKLSVYAPPRLSDTAY